MPPPPESFCYTDPMIRPKLILLNGFAGSGKSTIAKKYIQDHPLALLIEGDELIVNLGNWLQQEPEARQIVFELTKGLVSTHLSGGHDVVLPYLVTDGTHIAAFQRIAQDTGADFYSFLLHNEKETAITNLLKRGTWGKAGTDPLGEKDMPTILDLYERMESQLEHQENVAVIDQNGHSAEETYAQVLEHLKV
jgi:predicted kinase